MKYNVRVSEHDNFAQASTSSCLIKEYFIIRHKGCQALALPASIPNTH